MSRMVYFDHLGNEIEAPIGNEIEAPIGNEIEAPKSDVIKTRADRIRSMTDEELAKLLSRKIFYPWCEKEPCSGDCEICTLEWLEADNDL